MVGRAPCLGYPTKTAAILALFDQGVDNHEIARRCDTSVATVRITARKARGTSSRQTSTAPKAKPGKVKKPEPKGGVWSPEMMAKIRRLYGLTLIEIANACRLPPAEVLKYVIHGVIPPSGPVNDASQIDWSDTPALPPVQGAPDAIEEAVDTDFSEVAPQPEPAPGRDDDEAELAALAAAEVDPPEPEPEIPVIAGRPVLNENTRYYLRTAGGKYLHESTLGYVREKGKNAYCQPLSRIRTLRLKTPGFKDLIEEAAE